MESQQNSHHFLSLSRPTNKNAVARYLLPAVTAHLPPPDRQHWQSLTSVAITNFTNDLIPPRHNNCEKRELPVLQVLASPHNFLGLITPQSEYISQNRSASFILCFLSQNIHSDLPKNLFGQKGFNFLPSYLFSVLPTVTYNWVL